MSTRVDAEELEATRSEKFLAVVLAAFLLVGTIWFYVKIDDWVRAQTAASTELTSQEQRVLDERDAALEAQWRAEEELATARSELELAREDYEVALAAGDASTELERTYRLEQEEYAAAREASAEARSEARTAEERARTVEEERLGEEEDTTAAWIVAGVRLAFLAGWLAASYRLMLSLRRRESRYQPIGMAAVGTGAVLALVYAVDYITDYIDWLDLGPLVLSLFGAAVTLAAFAVLQRYLARRIPARRVRKGECPFCGYPVRGEGPHCEGCGREVVAECATCAQPRRVGSSHCIACGAA